MHTVWLFQLIHRGIIMLMRVMAHAVDALATTYGMAKSNDESLLTCHERYQRGDIDYFSRHDRSLAGVRRPATVSLKSWLAPLLREEKRYRGREDL